MKILQRSALPLLLSLLANDIEINPGPETSQPQPPFRLNRQTEALKTLYLNTRSLKAFVPSTTDCTSKQCKITLLQHLVYSGTYDIVCICETWLNASV